ncbi:MAG: hypothetical protein V5783_03735 [Pontiella sp.]
MNNAVLSSGKEPFFVCINTEKWFREENLCDIHFAGGRNRGQWRRKYHVHPQHIYENDTPDLKWVDCKLKWSCGGSRGSRISGARNGPCLLERCQIQDRY